MKNSITENMVSLLIDYTAWKELEEKYKQPTIGQKSAIANKKNRFFRLAVEYHYDYAELTRLFDFLCVREKMRNYPGDLDLFGHYLARE